MPGKVDRGELGCPVEFFLHVLVSWGEIGARRLVSVPLVIVCSVGEAIVTWLENEQCSPSSSPWQ
eukprot:8290732-Ditylum_brightwellii.AAC.1